MFERFTEKAVNVVYEAQRIAAELKSPEVVPEHMLLALISEAKGVSLKVFRMYNVDFEAVKDEVIKYTLSNVKIPQNITFSHGVKDILKRTLDMASKSGNSNILFEHLFLAVITDKNSSVQSILSMFGFDIFAAKELLNKLVQKKIKKLEHPEAEEEDINLGSFESVYEGEALSGVFDRAISKLSASGYEILGTEQIMESILESDDEQLLSIVNDNGLSSENFKEMLKGMSSRTPEYEEKKIIFTPNAFLMMNMAFQTAKELGSSVITPEHIVLSILKTKKGLAYEIIKSLKINELRLSQDILRQIEGQMSETLMVMKLAKEEARRLGRNVVGTEMFLLGILGEGTSAAAKVLNDLDLTLKDARYEVESLVGYGNEYFDKEIVFTNRAKSVLEKAWMRAKLMKRQKIEPSDILLAILDEPSALANKVLENSGIDTIDVRQGLKD